MNLNQSQATFRLADDPLSTDCYSVRLLLEFLQIPYESIYADVEQLDGKFECPVLFDSKSSHSGLMVIFKQVLEITQTQSQWMPAHLSAQIQGWLKFNEQLKLSLGKLRQANLSVDQFLSDESQLMQLAQRKLRDLDDHLCEQTVIGQRYLLGAQPTVADLMIFPQVALAWDAGVSLVPFLHIRRWINRIRHQNNFIPMAGLLAVN